MFPSTPPAIDLSRPRLKALTRWIRDDLDLLVAREGPNILRPDDVLTLHETFVQLRLASSITILDLRATGVHRAIQDIAGVATRWPGRLCDDCDRIIALWTEKFGPFGELRPFLYGRGGRLEGIASAAEHSREALLKRWSETCPEKLYPKQSHRQGDLGYKAGDWWINTLFAHHAGIIGLEAVEGGTTFDKHGAYALVLKDTGEVEASSEERFTYRVPQADRGKYRLTAATRASRDPVRVLRSHNINSVWGPKAGVRYEGLYTVTGWSIRQAKKADTSGTAWKEGDIIFEVSFARKDLIPMEEVTKRPTATEVDDYTEYKRLRKLHREGKRKAAHDTTLRTSLASFQQPAKAAPQIMPIIPMPMLGSPKAYGPMTPGATRRSQFKRPHFDLPDEVTPESMILVTPRSTTETDYFRFSPVKSTTLMVPPRNGNSHPGSPHHANDTSPHDMPSSGEVSVASNNGAQLKIQEVAPWVDLEAELSLHSSDDAPQESPSVKPGALERKHRTTFYRRHSPAVTPRKESGDASPGGSSKKDSRKSIFVRSRNPIAKTFDGAASESNSDFANAMDETLSSRRRKEQRTSSVRIHSPVPIRAFSPPSSSSPAKRRGVIYTDGSEDAAPTMFIEGAGLKILPFPDDDPFVDDVRTSPRGSLVGFISRPRAATPMGSDGMTPSSPPSRTADAMEMLRKSMDGEGKVVFRNPWVGMRSPKSKKRNAEIGSREA